MFEIFQESKLMIFTYFHATAFNQCVALNKPCIAFTPNADKMISGEWKKLWKELHKVGVFHSNYYSAARFLSKNSDSILNWWNSKKVQSTISKFRKYHARKENNSFYKLLQVLKD